MKEKIECPVVDCSYNKNTDEYEAHLRQPLILESTRSKENEDAHRDMDGFDENQELANLRMAVHQIKMMLCFYNIHGSVPPHKMFSPNRNIIYELDVSQTILKFIVEAFDNIDEHLRRSGQVPRAWSGSESDKLEQIMDLVEHERKLPHGVDYHRFLSEIGAILQEGMD